MEYDGSAFATGSAFLGKSEPAAFNFAKEIGLEPLPVHDRDSTIIHGEWIPNTWTDGLDKLPYPASVREGFKKFKKEILAIDLAKRSKELDNLPFSSFLKGYPAEVKQWWDNLRALQLGRRQRTNCGPTRDRGTARNRLRCGSGLLHLAWGSGRNHQEVGGDSSADRSQIACRAERRSLPSFPASTTYRSLTCKAQN